MKKVRGLAITGLVLIGMLAGCGDSEQAGGEKIEAGKKESAENQSSNKTLSDSEFQKMLTNPKKYKGDKVDFYAQIFVQPERDDDGTYIQAFADPENGEGNIIIGIEDPDLDVKNEDIIHVVGTVKDEMSGENAMGGEVTAPIIAADTIEKSDYATAFAPAVKTVDINLEQNQHGYKMKIIKMEIAENETRIYYEIHNTTKDTVSFYDFNSKLIAGNSQLEVETNFNYPENQSEILSGVKSSGILVYPKLEGDSGELSLHMDVSSDNYDLEFNPFVFKFNY